MFYSANQNHGMKTVVGKLMFKLLNVVWEIFCLSCKQNLRKIEHSIFLDLAPGEASQNGTKKYRCTIC